MHRPTFAALVLAFTVLLSQAQGAELGDAVVRSHIGQPLIADIELTAIEDATGKVEVRVANADVYRGANLAMPPVLSSLTMSVMRRDGRQYLHITSLKPVDAEYLLLFLDLYDGGRKSVRNATLWLTPDPHPAPPPPAPAPAPVAATPDTPPVVAPAAKPRVAAAPVAKANSLEQSRLCAALDYKNAALSAQILELEEKVRLLQLAIDDKPAPPKPAAKAVRKAAPAAPAVKKAEEKTPEPGLHWLLIGAIALAVLIGGAVGFVLWRKRRGKQVQDAVVKASFMDNMRARLKGLKKGAVEVERAEPVVE